jgi:hypothetical protein
MSASASSRDCFAFGGPISEVAQVEVKQTRLEAVAKSHHCLLKSSCASSSLPNLERQLRIEYAKNSTAFCTRTNPDSTILLLLTCHIE